MILPILPQLNRNTLQLEITKENYEGYLELYKFMLGVDSIKENWQQYDRTYNIIQYGTKAICNEIERINKLLNRIDIKRYSSPIISLSEYDALLEEVNKLRQSLITFKMLEMKYPYLNCEIELSTIEEALIESKLLIVKNSNHKIYYRINYKQFERYQNLKQIQNDIEPSRRYKTVLCDHKTPYVKIKSKGN